MATKYKLTYFNFRSQQSEPIRYIFAFAGVPFEDIRIPPGDTYPLLPQNIKKTLPYGQVPTLECNNQLFVQSAAIGRFLAREFGLAGEDNIESAKCDEIVDALFDFQTARWFVHLEEDLEKKADMQKSMDEELFPKYMSRFCNVVKENGGNFLVGKNVTWADLHMAYFIMRMEEKFPKLLQPYPEIHNAARFILSIPQIEEWNRKRQQDDPPQMHSGVVL